MKKAFQAGDKVLVHGRWWGTIVEPSRKHHQWVVSYEKKGVLLTNTLPATQLEFFPEQEKKVA